MTPTTRPATIEPRVIVTYGSTPCQVVTGMKQTGVAERINCHKIAFRILLYVRASHEFGALTITFSLRRAN